MISLVLALTTAVALVSAPAGEGREDETIRVLLVTGVDYPAHRWKETAPVVRRALERDKRFEVRIIEDPSFLASDVMFGYDVVFLHFRTYKPNDPGYEKGMLQVAQEEKVQANLSKFVNEHTAAAFHRAFGITTAAFRFAGISSAERYEEVKNSMAPTTAWSDDLYQWGHIADIVSGIRQALEAPDLPGHGVYTLAAGDTRCPEPTMELLERFRPDLVGRLTRPLEGRAPLLSIRRAQEAFGYSPEYRLGP